MIDSNECRLGIFGASETHKIMMDCKTKTYQKFIREKAGLIERKEIDNKYIFAGNALESLILDYAEKLFNCKIERDNQFFVEELNLRANLDGNTEEFVFEAKTRKLNKIFSDTKPPREYWEQVQVQMLSSKIKKAKLLILYLDEQDYEPQNMLGFKIKPEYYKVYTIKYDKDFIVKYQKKIKLANKHLQKLKEK